MMKNVCKILFCLLFFYGYSQNNLQNANWALAVEGGISFSPSMSSFNSSLESLDFPSASVSDQEGNLLFYTDGLTVWNSDNNIMTNGTGLLGQGGEFSQNVVIIPNPADVNKYYIVTISVENQLTTPRGLLFTEVDMSIGDGEVLLPINKPFFDDLGVLIDENHPNNIGRITTAKHANGLDYWLIAEMGNQIFSYLIDHTGIHPPLTSELSVSPIPVTYLDQNRSHGPMRISPDNNRILIGYTYTNTLSVYGSGLLYVGLFNAANGSVSNFIEISRPDEPIFEVLSAAEFSPDSRTVHFFYEFWDFTCFIDLIGTTLIPDNVIYVGNNTTNPVYVSNIQRAIDEKIYVDAIQSNNLSVINTPNLGGDSFSYGSVDVSSLEVGSKRIPTWVQWQGCLRFLVTENQITSSLNQERNNWIIASNEIINSTTRVVYHAGDFVELIPGFETNDDSQFSAYIEGCSDNFEYRPATSKQSKSNGVTAQQNQSFKKITIYPNPSSNVIEIKSNNKFSKITIVSLEGRIVYDKENDKTNSLQIDVSGFANGVYIVNVIDENGKLVSQKLIKN